MKSETQNERRERVREEMYRQACEAWNTHETERLNKIFAVLGSVDTHSPLTFFPQAETLEKVRKSVESGDRRAMLELLAIMTDSLRVFEILPREVRLALADGLEKMRGNLGEVKGFLPRGRGERSKQERSHHEYRALFTALAVESYRHDLGINLVDAEAKVADEFDMTESVVHKYWKKDHRAAKKQIEMNDSILKLAGAVRTIPSKKKVR